MLMAMAQEYMAMQLVFGRNPRLPPPLCETPFAEDDEAEELDETSKAFLRRGEIRQAGKEAWMKLQCERNLSRAVKARPRRLKVSKMVTG